METTREITTEEFEDALCNCDKSTAYAYVEQERSRAFEGGRSRTVVSRFQRTPYDEVIVDASTFATFADYRANQMKEGYGR